MRKFTDILLEKKVELITDLKDVDFVKRKKDGKIGEIDGIGKSRNIFGGFTLKIVYVVNFGNNEEEYEPKELELPTKDEIELYKNTKKYNL